MGGSIIGGSTVLLSVINFHSGSGGRRHHRHYGSSDYSSEHSTDGDEHSIDSDIPPIKVPKKFEVTSVRSSSVSEPGIRILYERYVVVKYVYVYAMSPMHLVLI